MGTGRVARRGRSASGTSSNVRSRRRRLRFSLTFWRKRESDCSKRSAHVPEGLPPAFPALALELALGEGHIFEETASLNRHDWDPISLTFSKKERASKKEIQARCRSLEVISALKKALPHSWTLLVFAKRSRLSLTR